MSGVKGKSGGLRVGKDAPAHRPLKYGEETEVMRVPKSLVPKIKAMMERLEKKEKRAKE